MVRRGKGGGERGARRISGSVAVKDNGVSKQSGECATSASACIPAHPTRPAGYQLYADRNPLAVAPSSCGLSEVRDTTTLTRLPHAGSAPPRPQSPPIPSQHL
jgi:hypothetical protein